MFLVLVAIGTTDALFALLGLRALFFLVSGLLDRLIYLSIGLSLILAFIGVKLVLLFAHLHAHSVPEISTGVSLGVIIVVLLATTLAGLATCRVALAAAILRREK